MTSSDRAKRKGADRVDKAKSQFYVDLAEGNTSDLNTENNSNQQSDDLDQPNISDDGEEHRQVTPSFGLSSPSSSLEKEGERSTENYCDSPCQDSNPTDRIETPRKHPTPFARGGVGRKSHTQLGVLVIPNSLCESRLYRERALPSQQSSGGKTMGTDYSKECVEDEDDESSSGSSCEISGDGVSKVAEQQYNSVVSQLCDYLYSTPILPSTHHPYQHSYSNYRPPIQPKPKNIPPPRIDVSKVNRNVKQTLIVKKTEKTTKRSVVDVISSNDGGQEKRNESCDSSGKDRNVSQEMESPVQIIKYCDSKQINEEYSSHSDNENSHKSSDMCDSSSSVEEPQQLRKIIDNHSLEAENISRSIPYTAAYVPIHKTNVECDSESQTSLPELVSVEVSNNTTTNSCMSDVPCDTNPVDLSNNPDHLTPKPSPELDSTEKRDKKIFLIAQELMTSERVFVDVLRLINIDFRNYIFENMTGNINRISPTANPSNNNNYKMNKNVMQEEDVNKILNYLPQLQNLNEEILQDLEGRITDWESHKKISDVIVRKGPFLKLYSAYIKEFQSQCDHLDECCHKYPQFAKVVKDFELSDRCAKLSIRHYMLKPVQRIPQYRLLLEDYLKKLPDDSIDYVDTQTALAVVSNVASHANDTMKQGTNFMKLLALQDRLSRNQNNNIATTNGSPINSTNSNHHVTSPTTNTHYELIRPGRSLLKEGELLKLCRRGMQPRYYILLSDVLLYTSFINSGPGGALRVNYELPLEGMRVETPKAEDFKNEFSVISTSRSFTLQAKSAEERDEWIQALRDAIEDNASRRSTFLRAKIPSFQHPNTSSLGKQAPVWIPDDRVTMCQQCTAEFTLTFRRHHCRACGKVVCDHCSANRAPLQYKRNQSHRVCGTCFEVLQKEFECRYEGTTTIEDPNESKLRRVSSLKAQFKRGIKENKSQKHNRKRVPERLLEVCASDAASQMCGYLRVMVRRSLRRGWFVLKDRVLYEYRAPQDVCALQSLPVLGYQVEAMDKEREIADGLDNCLAFQLTHPNRPPIVFHTDSPHLAEKWIQAMKEAVVLS